MEDYNDITDCFVDLLKNMTKYYDDKHGALVMLPPVIALVLIIGGACAVGLSGYNYNTSELILSGIALIIFGSTCCCSYILICFNTNAFRTKGKYCLIPLIILLFLSSIIMVVMYVLGRYADLIGKDMEYLTQESKFFMVAYAFTLVDLFLIVIICIVYWKIRNAV